MTTHVAAVIDKLRAMGEDVGTDDDYRGFTTGHMIQLLEELQRFRNGDIEAAQRAQIDTLSQQLLEARTRLNELSAWLATNTRVNASQEPVQAAIGMLEAARHVVRTSIPVLARHWEYVRSMIESAGYKLPT
jgi:hypothetical protein